MKGKSRLWIYVLFSIITIFLGSCANLNSSKTFVFNESLPHSELAIIHYAPPVDIVGYNGIPVNWKAQLFSAIQLQIPGGNTQFILNGSYGSSGQGYTIYRDVPFSYLFEKGKEYSVIMNHHFIHVFQGKSSSKSDYIISFDMNNSQRAFNWYKRD